MLSHHPVGGDGGSVLWVTVETVRRTGWRFADGLDVGVREGEESGKTGGSGPWQVEGELPSERWGRPGVGPPGRGVALPRWTC